MKKIKDYIIEKKIYLIFILIGLLVLAFASLVQASATDIQNDLDTCTVGNYPSYSSYDVGVCESIQVVDDFATLYLSDTLQSYNTLWNYELKLLLVTENMPPLGLDIIHTEIDIPTTGNWITYDFSNFTAYPIDSIVILLVKVDGDVTSTILNASTLDDTFMSTSEVFSSIFDAGTTESYNEGYDDAYSVAYDLGYDSGYDIAYIDGFNAGEIYGNENANTPNVLLNGLKIIVGFIFNMILFFFTLEVFDISLLEVTLGISLLMIPVIILKIVRG